MSLLSNKVQPENMEYGHTSFKPLTAEFVVCEKFNMYYRGDVSDFIPHGKGTIIEIDPETKKESILFEGQWEHGYRNGPGKDYRDDGSIRYCGWYSDGTIQNGQYYDISCTFVCNSLEKGLVFDGIFTDDGNFHEGTIN